MAYVSCALKSSESVGILAKLLMAKQYELLEDEQDTIMSIRQMEYCISEITRDI